jgi:hypothetical protein
LYLNGRVKKKYKEYKYYKKESPILEYYIILFINKYKSQELGF